MDVMLKDAFAQRRALKVISGLKNLNTENVLAVVRAAEAGGATFVDIAADADFATAPKS